MKTLALIFFLSLLAGCPLFAVEIETLLQNDGEFFEAIDREKPEWKTLQKKFRWLDSKKTSARAGVLSQLTLFGKPVCETVLHYSDDGLALERVDVSIYNRGDAETILDNNAFEKQIDEVVRNLDELLGEPSQSKKESFAAQDSSGRLRQNHGEIRQTVWVKGKLVYILRTSRKGPKRSAIGEFIQLEIEKFNPKNDPRKLPILARGNNESGKKIQIEPKKNVVRDDDGTVWIDDIPMVDQGFKGYCVVSVGERIARYYGNENLNQHILAEAAGTSSAFGSTYEEMLETLKRLRTKIGATPREIYRRFDDSKSVLKMIDKYNSLAKKKGKPKIDVEQNGFSFFDLDPEIYSAIWKKDAAKRKRFLSAVKKNVDQGQPLVWLVYLGIVKEKNGSQSSGGHMRIINGYNEKTQEIIYTDSWGIGHEKKRMSYDDAWTITSGLVGLVPR